MTVRFVRTVTRAITTDTRIETMEAILKDYQRLIANHIVDTPRCAIWASMGMGKTLSSLTAVTWLEMIEDPYPVLILAPLRVATSTWPKEVRKWDHTRHLRVSPIVGNLHQRTQACQRKADLYTCNFDNLEWLVNYYGDAWPFKTVIADESTRLKSFRTRQGGVRAKALSQVAFSKIKRFVELTGTPAPNGLVDLWGQLWFVDGGRRLGRTYTAFSDRWFRTKRSGFGLEPLENAQKEIETALKDVCLTVDAKDFFDLQDPIVTPVYVDLPQKVRLLYKDMEKEMFMQLGDHEVEAFNAAAKTQKLLQLCSGAVYVNPLTESDADKTRSKEWRLVHDEKINALRSIVEEANGAPVLVAYHFKSDLARLLKAFPQGRELDTNPQTETEWNEGKIPVLFAHPGCLHPSTEVLTEYRGWVKIVDVAPSERVFDGVEYVSHGGCKYAGFKEVMNLFGITLTPDHPVLVDGDWVEAKDVRTDSDTRRKARYTYEGNGDSGSSVCSLWRGAENLTAKSPQAQPTKEGAMSLLHRGNVPPTNGHPDMVQLEGPSSPCGRQDGQELRGPWNNCLRGVARLQRLLRRYGRELRTGFDDRTNRRKRALLQRELPVGDTNGATSKQKNKQVLRFWRRAVALGRGLSKNGVWEDNAMLPISAGNDTRTSNRFMSSVDVRNRKDSRQRTAETKTHVFDLVDCGPRSRFVVRNAEGEMFIVHNSAGHGLNLQFGGNILVFFSHDWNLENRLQIIERIGPVRQLQAGLDRPVFIYNIIAENTVDELVMARVETKKDIQDILLEAMKRKA